MARGSVQLKNGRKYIVYDAGRRWDAKQERYVRRQKWEKVPYKENRSGLMVPPSKRDAEKLLTKRLREIDQGEFIEPSSEPFGDFLETWKNKYAAAQVESSTLQRYESYFRAHLKPKLGHLKLSRIKVEDIQEFKAALTQEGLSPGYIKIHLALVRQILNHAVEWGRIRSNPALKVTYPRIPRNEAQFWEPHEFRTVLSAIPQKWEQSEFEQARLTAFFLFGVTGCLRIGELFAAKWKNINEPAGTYFVNETWQRPRSGQSAILSTPKTESSIATVNISPRAIDALKVWQAHLKAMEAEMQAKTGEEWNKEGLVFPSRTGGCLDYWNFCNRVFRPVIKKANEEDEISVPEIGTHGALRHTGAALMIDANENPKYIQRQLRHASIKMTYDVYGHLFKDVHTEAPSRMDATLFGEAGETQMAG